MRESYKRRVGLNSLVLGSLVEERQERNKMQRKDKFEMSGQAKGKARATGAAVQEGDKVRREWTP